MKDLFLVFFNSARLLRTLACSSAFCCFLRLPYPPSRKLIYPYFLDCQRGSCDRDFIKRELPFIDFVRDRQDSQVHVLITRQRTAGGRQHELMFYGSGEFEANTYQLKSASLNTDTKDQIRRNVLAKLKLGLTPTYYKRISLIHSQYPLRKSKNLTLHKHVSQKTPGMAGYFVAKSAAKWKKKIAAKKKSIGGTFPAAV